MPIAARSLARSGAAVAVLCSEVELHFGLRKLIGSAALLARTVEVQCRRRLSPSPPLAACRRRRLPSPPWFWPVQLPWSPPPPHRTCEHNGAFRHGRAADRCARRASSHTPSARSRRRCAPTARGSGRAPSRAGSPRSEPQRASHARLVARARTRLAARARTCLVAHARRCRMDRGCTGARGCTQRSRLISCGRWRSTACRSSGVNSLSAHAFRRNVGRACMWLVCASSV